MAEQTGVTTQTNRQLSPKDQIKGFFERDDVKKKFIEILGDRGTQYVASVLQLSLTDSSLQNAVPATIYGSAMIAATLDLPVNKNLGYAWIIGYKNRDGVMEAQFQMGYKGYIQLALRSQQYEKINAIPVYQNQFKSWNALTETLEGDFTVDGEGPVVGYVCYFQLKNGFEKVVYWSKAKVDAHAKQYSKTYHFKNSTWKTNFDGMALKTVIKNALEKWGILSVQMQKAIEADQGVTVEKDGVLQTSYEDLQEVTVLSKEEERLLSFIESSTSLKELDDLKPNVTVALSSKFEEKYAAISSQTKSNEVDPPKPTEQKPEEQAKKKSAVEIFREFQDLLSRQTTVSQMLAIQDLATTESMKKLWDSKYDDLVAKEMDDAANEVNAQNAQQ